MPTLIQYYKVLSKFGQQQLIMVNYVYGFIQSETGKYFGWIMLLLLLFNNKRKGFSSHRIGFGTPTCFCYTKMAAVACFQMVKD